jgi:hypothetical protein
MAAGMALPLELAGRPKPYIMAHRGNRVACPENTLASFQRAFAADAGILGTDLHFFRFLFPAAPAQHAGRRTGNPDRLDYAQRTAARTRDADGKIFFTPSFHVRESAPKLHTAVLAKNGICLVRLAAVRA